MAYKPKPKQSSYTWQESFPSFSDPSAFAAGDPCGYIIAYSGGRDSNALMDMAMRITGDARHVHPFIMSLLPEMDYYQFWRDWAKKRWGVEVREYQHWALSWYIRRGVFRLWKDPTFPRVVPSDIEKLARMDTGLSWVGYGYKSIDSLQRRGMMAKWPLGISHEHRRFAPLKTWTGNHVRGYLERRHLNQPNIKEYQSRGIDLSPECMWWLREYWPGDYKKILKLFPLAVAQADRWPILQANIHGHERNVRNMLAIEGGKLPDSALESSWSPAGQLDDLPREPADASDE